ncbi:MAG: S-layer homology domain-containing protein [Lawsonibacter sp.]
MKKRLLAIAMSLTMTLSLLPLSSFAEPLNEAAKNETEISVEPVDDSTSEMEAVQDVTGTQKSEGQQTTKTDNGPTQEGENDASHEVRATAVAKVGNIEYATLTDAFAALSSKDHVLTLIDQNAWTYQNVYWKAGDQNGSTDTLRAAVEAAHKVDNAENIQIICKPATEIADSAPHIDVTRNISIYANGADFTGDDLSIGTYQAPEKEVTSVDIYDAKNLVVWGQPVDVRTDVWNVNFVDCANDGWNVLMYRGGEKGTAKLNLTLTNCKATGYTDSTVHTTADGSIRIKECAFENNCAPVNIAHKQSGTMKVVIDNCTFTKCGKLDANNYFAPVRFVNNSTDGALSASVKNTTFVERIGTNGDILIGDGRAGKSSNDVALTVQSTKAQVQFQTPGYYNEDGTVANPDKLTTANVEEDENRDFSLGEQFAVAKIGTEFYQSLEAAIAAAGEGATVTLLKNVTESVTIPEGKTIVLNLSDYTLTGSKTGERMNNVVTNNGTLTICGGTQGTIMGGSDNGTGTDGRGGIALVNTGTCTIESGTIKRGDNGTFGNYTVKNDGTMYITGGHIENNSNVSSMVINLGTMVVSGGTLKQDSMTALKNEGTLTIKENAVIDSDSQSLQNWSNATIEGGTLNGSVTSFTWTDGETNSEATTTISGGSVTGDVLAVNYKGEAKKAPVVNISGDAKIIGNLYAQTGSSANPDKNENVQDTSQAKVEVSGGSFSEPVDNFFLDDALKAELKDSSNQEAPYSYYPTTEEAQKHASAGDTVTDLTVTKDPDKTYYDVTLDYADGVSANLKTPVESGKSYTVPADPSRSGYDFLYWTSGSSRYYKGNTIQVTGPIMLTAVWEKNTPVEPDRPSGGGSSSDNERTYAIVTEDDGHGSVTVSADEASAGTRITVTVKPDSGYALDELTVTDAKNKELSVTKRSETTYTFHMADSKVTVEASFTKDSTVQKPDTRFDDVAKSAWYCKAVDYVAENGIMSGVSAREFAPNAGFSRAMLAQTLYAMSGKPAVKAESAFADVAASAWYADAVNWAAKKGYVSGVGEGMFAPDASITREQMALILYRYAGSPDASGMALKEFADGDSVSAYAVDAVRWAVHEGLISGMENNTLAPQGTATRAQVAQILMNFHQKLDK